MAFIGSFSVAPAAKYLVWLDILCKKSCSCDIFI